MEVNDYGTTNLFLETLTKMGCKYELSEGGFYHFCWHEGYFCAESNNNTPYVTVWDMLWKVFDYNHKSSYSRVTDTVNELNRASSVNVFYAIDEDDHSLSLHSKREFLFLPTSVDLTKYLADVLEEFIIVHLQFNAELQKLEHSDSFLTAEIMTN